MDEDPEVDAILALVETAQGTFDPPCPDRDKGEFLVQCAQVRALCLIATRLRRPVLADPLAVPELAWTTPIIIGQDGNHG